jgi:hypothetical protein
MSQSPQQDPSGRPPPQPYPHAIPYAAAARPQLERDRRGGLIAFGIISILIGALAGCLAILTPLSLMMVAFVPRAAVPPQPVVQIAMTAAIYAAAATLFIWTGIGSIRCRRWVRPIVISLGWPMIIMGVLGLAGWALLARDLPAMMAAARPPPPPPGVPAPPAPPPGADVAITAAIAVVMAVFYVIVPTAYVWFYSTRAVKQTLEAYDPGISWTQRPPLPVFAGAVNLALGGLMTLTLATVGAAPFFGFYVEGVPAALLVVAASAVLFAAAVLFYRVSILGWLLAVAVVTLGFVSAIMTVGQRGMSEFYSRGHADPEFLRMLERSPTMTGTIPVTFMAVTFLICITYLIWVRGYFARHRREPPTAAAYPSPT